MHTAGSGRYKVWMKEEQIGDNRLYILGGGEQAHIGGIVVKEPGREAHVIRQGNHYDYMVLRPLAEQACEIYNTTVVVLGGIHIDNASKEEIDKLVKNCEELKKCI